MESDGKKISFGFAKLQRKPNLMLKAKPPNEEIKKVELIDCLEGQAIKIKDKVEQVHEPLVIPIKDNQKNLLDRVREAKSKQLKVNKDEILDTRPDSELSIEELAARELLRDAKNHPANRQPEKQALILPQNEEVPSFEGEKEPTLEDYESVPISDYGFAMLRGMGWKEGMGIGKNNKTISATNAPELRPKGLGLGATKILKTEEEKNKKTNNNGEELQLVKGAFVKIIAGSKRGNYCEVLGFDDEAGRVIVKSSLKDEILTLNEFMLVPVTKEEFSKGCKVLNNAKYEDYKKISDLKLEKTNENHSDNRKNEKFEDNKLTKQEPRSRSNSRTRDNYKHKDDVNIKKERKSRSRDRSPSTSKKHIEKHTNKKHNYNSSDEKESKRKSKKEKSKHRDRSRTPDVKKTHRRKSVSASSEDSEYDRKNRNKSKKSRHKGKSKQRNRDRSRSLSASDDERRKKHKEQYDLEKKKKSRKNKCKSRHHRRSSSSSSSDDKAYYNRKNKR